MDLLPGQVTQEQLDAATGERPSLLSRLGQGLANQPSDVFNQVSRLAFNLGLQDEAAPVQIPRIYDLPPSEGFAEGAVDWTASAIGTLPLMLTGEGVALAGSRALGLGKTATNIARGAGGFVPLSEKPEDIAHNALLGGTVGVVGPKIWEGAKRLFGRKAAAAAEEAISEIKTPASETSSILLPRNTRYASGKSAEKSARYMELSKPYVSKSAQESAEAILAAEEEAAAAAAATGANQARVRDFKTRVQGLLMPSAEESSYAFRRKSTDEALAHAESRLDTHGRLLREKLRKESGTEPPPGSLIRNPLISEGEALISSRTRSILSPSEITTKAGTTIDRTPPPGSLIRHPRFSEGEALAFSRGRGESLPLPPAAEPPVATLQPKKPGTKVVGPVLVAEDGTTILAKGEIGISKHKDFIDPSQNPSMELFDSMLDDARPRFVDDQGNLLSRTEAGKLGVKAGQLPADFTGEAHSQHFIKHRQLTGATKTLEEAAAARPPTLPAPPRPAAALSPTATGKQVQQAVKAAPKMTKAETKIPAPKPSKKAPKVATSQPDKFQNLADQQRGKPESAMLTALDATGGGVIHMMEHVGDLIHRMTQNMKYREGGFHEVKEKLRIILRRLQAGPKTQSYPFEAEFKMNLANNAESRGIPLAQFEENAFQKMQAFADEHRKLPTYNEVQKLAQEGSVAVGERRFDDARKAFLKLQEYIDQGEPMWNARAREGYIAPAPPPKPKKGKKVATSQQEKDAAKLAATPTPSSSLEKVLVDVDGKMTEGIVLSHDAASGLSKVKVNGQVLDKWTHKLEPIEAAGGGNFVNKDATQIGGLNQFAKLEVEVQKQRTGMKLKIKPGEAGFSYDDIMGRIATVATFSAIGGVAGAAISDDDKRMSMAITFALGAGIAGYNLPRMIEAYAKSHPKVGAAGSLPAKVKVMAKTAGEAVTNTSRVAQETSADYAGAEGTNTIVRWFNRNFTTNPDIKRAVDAGRGVIEDMGRVIRVAQATLAQTPISNQQKDLIHKLIHGRIDYATFNRDIGHDGIQQAVTAIHQSITVMQNIFADALGPGNAKLNNIVRNKLGRYVTETFKVFHDPHYMPSEQKIINAAWELDAKKYGSLDTRIKILRNYLHEVKVNRHLYGAGNKSKLGESLGSAILRKDENVGPAFKEFLGLYDDPIEQLAATADKLIRASSTAEVFNQFAKLEKVNGLKYVYTPAEKDAMRTLLETELRVARGAGATDKVATLQQKLDDLDHYVWNPENAQHGKLSGTLVDRRIVDQLQTFDSIMTSNSSGMIRAISDANNFIKFSKTVASPLQLSRQIVSMPFLGFLNRTGPIAWKRAYDAIYNNPAELSRLTQLGLMSGDSIKGMLQADFSEMLKGNFDRLATNSFWRKKGHQWMELYRAPDLIVRVAGFLKEEERLLLKYGTNQSERAAREAIDFANRYSMNYAAVPPGIKKLRKIPFVNQFLTFAYETARITKNLAEDAIYKRDPYAAAVLTGFATLPAVVQHLSESTLSAEDRKQWEKVKDLGPAYSRSNFKFVRGKDKQGNFQYVDFTPIVLHDKWLKMIRDIGNHDREALGADNPVFGWQNTPLLNIAVNQITGKDLHTKQSLNSVGRRLDSIRKDVLPPLLGTDLDKIVASLTPNAEGGLGIRDLQTGQASSIAAILGSYASSLRQYTVSPTYLVRRAITEAQQQTAAERAYLYRVSRSNATLQQKADALSKYQAAQKQIMMALRDKLRLSPSQESSDL